MATKAKGCNIISTQLHDLTEEDRDEIIEFATHPANGVTAVTLYLNGRGIKGSITSVHKWLNQMRTDSEKVDNMRIIFNSYKGVTAHEINAFVATLMTETIVKLNAIIEKDGLDARKIQSLTALAKEARSSAVAMSTPESPATIKELEQGFFLSFARQLESIFEKDEVTLEKVRNACQSISIQLF